MFLLFATIIISTCIHLYQPDFAQDNYNENGEDGDNEDDGRSLLGAQHVIALIDCHPDMFQSPNPFDWSLKLVLNLLQQTIEQTAIRKTGKRNSVGILLYNTRSGRDNDQKGNTDIGNDNHGEDEDDDDKMDDEEDETNNHDDEEDEQSPVSEKTVHRLLDLTPPGIKQVLSLRKMLDKKDRDLQKEFCPVVEEDLDCAPLQTALEEATKMFLDVKPKSKPKDNISDNRSIWIFTNQEDPYSKEKARTVETIAIDAKEEKIAIVVLPLVSTSIAMKNHPDNEKFISPFFESIRTKPKPNDDSNLNFNHRFQNFEEMDENLDDMTKEVMKNRRSYYGPMHILRPESVRSSGEPAIMIDWYSSVQILNRPGKVQIDNETNRETVKIRAVLEKDTGKEVATYWTKPNAEQKEIQKNQLGVQRFRQLFDFRGELLPITEDDSKQILENSNGFFEPGLTILGFRPRDAIPYYHCVSTTYLIFPNESEVKGSNNAFFHLYCAMVRKNVLAVGEVLHRKTSQSRLVAIYPLEDEAPMPPGMYVMQLPFEDDMRAISSDRASKELHEYEISVEKSGVKIEDKHETASNEASNEIEFLHPDSQPENLTGSIASEKLVDAAIELMDKQNLSERTLGEHYDNAALAEFYSYLQSVAFDMPRETNSYDTRVSVEKIMRTAEAEIDAFNAYLPVDVEEPKGTTSKKRARDLVPDDSGIAWEELYKRDEIEACTIHQLKKYLRSVGLHLSGRKSDLIERVIESLEQVCAKHSIKKEQSLSMDV